MIAFAIITITICLVFGCVRIVARYWELFADTELLDRETRLRGWFAKGVVFPIAIWIWFNFALAPGRIAIFPDALVKELSGNDWVWLLCWLVLPTALLAGSFWAAVTLAWLVFHLVTQTESRREIFGAGIFWGVLLLPVVGLIIYYCGWATAGVGVIILMIPLLRDLTALGTPRKLAPAYARAIERIKGGQYAAAELEVIRQLERREDDFEGWMILARLYAHHFGDLVEAERTVREVCRQVSTTRMEYCNALSQLAEWHLTIGKDPNAAHRIWNEICETYPHSEFADAARRRTRQLAEGTGERTML